MAFITLTVQETLIQGHVKDLFLIPRESLSLFKNFKVDQDAVVGNNDHSLAVLGPDTTLKHRRRLLLNIYGRRLYPDSPEKTRPSLSPNSKFRSKMRRRDPEQLTNVRGLYVDELAVNLDSAPAGWPATVTAMQSALLKTLPKSKFHPVPQSWQELAGYSLQRKIEACAKVRRQWAKDPTSDVIRESLKSRKQELHNLVSQSKTKFDKLHIERFLTKGKQEKAASAALLRGNPAKDPHPGVSPQGFAEHFEKLFARESEDDLLNLSRYAHLLPPKSRPRVELGGAPTVIEVAQAIDRLNLKKASGADGLTAEMFKAAKDVIAHRMTEDLAQFWPTGPGVNFDTRCEVFSGWQHAEVVTIFKGKGSKSDPGGSRGIFLLELGGKITTSIIAERLTGLIDSFLSDSQCGFRKRRGTNHQIHVLRRLQSEVRKASLPAAAVFVDFEKAFDSPPRDAIFECLEYVGCPPDILAVIRAIHLDPHACVRGSEAWFRVARGIRQGCVLGPMLFNLVLEFSIRIADFQHSGVEMVCVDKKDLQCPRDILGQVFKVEDAAYADDIALVGTSLPQLENSLQKLQNVTGKIGLNISVKKTEWMWLFAHPGDQCAPTAPGPNIPPCCKRISLNGKAVVHVNQFTYLGALFTEEGSDTKEIDVRIFKSKSKLFSLNFLWKSNTSIQSKIRLFKQLVLPVLLYGCETWSLTNNNWASLEVFFNTARLAICNKRRYQDGIVLTNEELHNRVQLPPVSTFVVPRQINFSIGTIFSPSSLMARKMTFAKVNKPIKIISGTERVNFDSCLRANLGFILDLLSLSNPDDLNSRVRKFSAILTEHNTNVGGISSEEQTRNLDISVPFTILGEWQRDTLPDNDSWVGSVTRSICGMAGPSKGELRNGQELVRPHWPNLQRQVNRDRHYLCIHCNGAYTEKKALNRHIKQAHREKTSSIEALNSLKDRHGTRRTSRAKGISSGGVHSVIIAGPGSPTDTVGSGGSCQTRTAATGFKKTVAKTDGNIDSNLSIPIESPISKPAAGGEPKLKNEGGSAKAFLCPHCECSYATKGWLTRHLRIKHGEDGSRMPLLEPNNDKETVVDLSPSKKKKNKTFKGLHCTLCNAHGAGEGWVEKTLINHWSSVHKINYKTGKPSRTRAVKQLVPK